MKYGVLIFLLLVFLAVVFLSQGTMMPVFKNSNRLRKRIKERLHILDKVNASQYSESIVRQKYLRALSPFEQQLESLPGMGWLSHFVLQSGRRFPAYQLVVFSLLLAVVVFSVVWMVMKSWQVSMLSALASLAIPFYLVHRERAKRFAKFEEQLPEAIDLIQRALKVGHPFSQTLQLVSETMDEPIATEFGIAFSDISYGGDVRRSMLGLLDRIPTISVMVLATAVSLQRETGGNLAESLGQISSVIRSRFKFQRKVKSLSAEGRMSGVILVSIPLVLFGFMWIFSPAYIARLLNHPKGITMIEYAIGLCIVGMLWIRRLIRIEA